MKTRVLEVSQVQTVKELLDTLKEFVGSHDPEVVFLVSETSASKDFAVTVKFVENTLTDGSLTYDVRIS